MTIQDQQSVVSTQTQDPAAVGQPVVSSSVQTRRVTATPDGSELARRIVVLVFGLIQLVIGLRILLLVVDARTGNGIVSAILNISQVFVGPFEGILKTDALHSGGSNARHRGARRADRLDRRRGDRPVDPEHLPA